MNDGKLTIEVLNAAFQKMWNQGSVPRHDCRFDGHVEHFMSTRCVYCRDEIRTLTPDENHMKFGEFS